MSTQAAAQKLIAFTVDKNGRPIAYRDSRCSSARWIRIGVDEARLLIAQGLARQVPYIKLGR